MHMTIRHYEGVANPSELVREISATFLPRARQIPGFVAYYFVDTGEAGGRMVSVSVFDNETGTAESNRLSAEWNRDHPNLIPTASLVEVGEVLVGG
jgi:hypothetical protein